MNEIITGLAETISTLVEGAKLSNDDAISLYEMLLVLVCIDAPYPEMIAKKVGDEIVEYTRKMKEVRDEAED